MPDKNGVEQWWSQQEETQDNTITMLYGLACARLHEVHGQALLHVSFTAFWSRLKAGLHRYQDDDCHDGYKLLDYLCSAVLSQTGGWQQVFNERVWLETLKPDRLHAKVIAFDLLQQQPQPQQQEQEQEQEQFCLDEVVMDMDEEVPPDAEEVLVDMDEVVQNEEVVDMDEEVLHEVTVEVIDLTGDTEDEYQFEEEEEEEEEDNEALQELCKDPAWAEAYARYGKIVVTVL
jgi:hypothetical protein